MASALRLPRARFAALRSSTATRRTAPSTLRLASTAHGADADGEDNFYTHETFTSKPFIVTAGVIALWYGLYKASLENAPAFSNDPSSFVHPGSTDLIEEAEDERRPWITRYMAYHFAPQTELYRKRNADNYDAIVDAASNKLLVSTAQMPSLRRHRSWSVFDDASPFNLEVGTEPDLSDLKIKTYADDRKMPEKKEDNEEGGDSDE